MGLGFDRVRLEPLPFWKAQLRILAKQDWFVRFADFALRKISASSFQMTAGVGGRAPTTYPVTDSPEAFHPASDPLLSSSINCSATFNGSAVSSYSSVSFVKMKVPRTTGLWGLGSVNVPRLGALQPVGNQLPYI